MLARQRSTTVQFNKAKLLVQSDKATVMLKVLYLVVKLHFASAGFGLHPPTSENQGTTSFASGQPSDYKNMSGIISFAPLIDQDTTTMLPEYDWIFTIHDSPFISFKMQHKQSCPAEQNVGQIREPPFPCCGSCSYEYKCEDYGSCCLGKFVSFIQAAASTANTLYRCQPAEWRPEDNVEQSSTESYWMISKCPGLSFSDLQQLCENTVLDSNVISIAPVTDAVNGVTYRNRFCAQCNGRTESDAMVNWKLQILSDKLITLPDNDLLSQIRSSRGARRGRIQFIAPKYIKAETCRIIPYQVSECNVTGRWRPKSRYSNYIEKACHAFVDPFNGTYKNYFCFLCNQEDGDNSQPTCVNTLGANPNPIDEPYTFQRLVDVDATRISENLDENQVLNCNASQYKDTRLMRCLNVDCHTEDSLVDGVCQNKKQENICYVFMLLINPEEDMQIDGLDYRNFGDYLRDVLRTDYGWNYWGTITEMKMYYHETWTNSTDRFIVTLMLDFALTNASTQDLARILIIHQTKNFLPMSILSKKAFVEQGVIFVVELVSHNVSSLEHDTFYFYDTFDLASLLEMRLLVDIKYVESRCLLHQAVIYNKLQICPFLKLGIPDLPFYNEEGRRYFNDSYYYIFEWEYEILEDEIHICLEDYLPIYVANMKKYQDHSSSAETIETTVPWNSGAPNSVRPFLCFTTACIYVLLQV